MVCAGRENRLWSLVAVAALLAATGFAATGLAAEVKPLSEKDLVSLVELQIEPGKLVELE